MNVFEKEKPMPVITEDMEMSWLSAAVRSTAALLHCVRWGRCEAAPD